MGLSHNGESARAERDYSCWLNIEQTHASVCVCFDMISLQRNSGKSAVCELCGLDVQHRSQIKTDTVDNIFAALEFEQQQRG